MERSSTRAPMDRINKKVRARSIMTSDALRKSGGRMSQPFLGEHRSGTWEGSLVAHGTGGNPYMGKLKKSRYRPRFNWEGGGGGAERTEPGD